MFDIGFAEIAVILLLGLLVLGPERLPRAIRTVGYYWRKVRTLAISAQQQLERELDAEDMRRHVAKTRQQMEQDVEEIRKPVEQLAREVESSDSTDKPRRS